MLHRFKVDEKFLFVFNEQTAISKRRTQSLLYSLIITNRMEVGHGTYQDPRGQRRRDCPCLGA